MLHIRLVVDVTAGGIFAAGAVSRMLGRHDVGSTGCEEREGENADIVMIMMASGSPSRQVRGSLCYLCATPIFY